MSYGILKMVKVGYTTWISMTHYTSSNHLFTYYYPNIGISRPMTTYSHEEENIWTILRMNASFTKTKDGTSAQSAGTPRINMAAPYQPQRPIITKSSHTPSKGTYTINNRIRTYATRHHMSFIQMTKMWKSQSH